MTDTPTNNPIWRLPADHPAFAGHFPGQPIVPGAMLLDRVLQTIANRLDRPPGRLRIDSAKFIQPVGPDEAVAIELRDTDGGWRFTLKTGDQTVASGAVSTAPETENPPPA